MRLHEHDHRLIAALRADAAIEAAMWEKIADLGTPLVEPDPASADHRLVTFVCRLEAGTRHVVVQPAGYPDAPDHVLAQVPGTATCHATYRYRKDARLRYSFIPDLPLVAWNDEDPAKLAAQQAFVRAHPAQRDPHNRNEIGVPAFAVGNKMSLLALEDAPDESAIVPRTDAALGRLDECVFSSEILGNDRKVWVYTPAGYDESREACNVLLVFDGAWYLSLVPTQHILDNLIAERRIRPLVAVLIDNVTSTSRDSELACNEQFASSIERELLPWLRAQYRVSDRPEAHCAAGSSLGGLCASHLGLRLPHLIGNVISQAGVFWWGPDYRWDGPRSQAYDAEWLTERFRESPRVPVRFWVEIGLLEDLAHMIEPNRRMKAVLEERGYDVTYREFFGGHDHALWRGTFAQAVAAMCR